MKLRLQHTFILLLLASFFAQSCSITRRVGPEEHLLDKNTITIEGTAKNVDEYDLYGILKQKANRKTASLFRFNLRMHNIPSPTKTQHRIIKEHRKLMNKNMRRLSKGKDTLEYSQTLSEWLMFTVGEPAVIIDTGAVSRSTEQLELYMQKKGYFNAKVRDSVVYKKKRKAEVYYIVTPGQPYTIGKINFANDNSQLDTLVKMSFVDKELDPTYMHIGDNFDVDVLDKERTRITVFLRNRGYYEFNKDYIKFEIDSSFGDHTVTVNMNIKPVYYKQALPEDKGDTILERDHVNYKIGYVYYYTDYSSEEGKGEIDDPDLMRDTIFDDKGRVWIFLYKDELKLDPQVLIKSTFLTPYTGFYKQKYVERSYKRLSSLGVFQSVNIQFRRHEDTYTDRDRLDCIYYLTPATKKFFSFEASGISQSGNPGLSSSFIFTNKNSFGGGEQLRLKLAGAFQAQQTVTDIQGTSDDGSDIGNFRRFELNTIEFGPELSLRLPKLQLPSKVQDEMSNTAMPFSYVSIGANYQERPDYIRRALNLSYMWEIKETKTKLYNIYLADHTYIKLNKSAEFQAQIDSTNDVFLQNSYQDLFIPSIRGVFTYNSQRSTKVKDKRNLWFATAGLQLSGFMLAILNTTMNLSPQDENKNYLIAGVPYTQFIRIHGEGKYYRTFSKTHSAAFRLFAGYGEPRIGRNLHVLPFERSFFGGGANGLRAYKARTLGPGTYFDPARSFDKIGDIQFEVNIEDRFSLIGPLELALFLDAGNIWLLKPDDLRPGGDFNKGFINEFAVGGGIGFRFDFDFFIIRLDAAWPLRDPSLPENERWVWEDKDVYNTWEDSPNPYILNFNLGIGYPF